MIACDQYYILERAYCIELGAQSTLHIAHVMQAPYLTIDLPHPEDAHDHTSSTPRSC